MSTILIVEDNDLNRRLFVDLLTTRGYTVFEAIDETTAFAQLHEHSPDLVLMDIQLPNVSGLEITRKIRSNTALKQPKIIAVSAFVYKADVDKALQAGCDDYIAKPISIAPFFQKIEANLK